MRGWESSAEDGLHAPRPHAQAHGARHSGVGVAGGEALAAKGQVPAGEEHHGGRPEAAGEARVVWRRTGAARVHERRRRRLRRAGVARGGGGGELLDRRPRRGRGLLQLRVQGDRGGLLGERLGLPRRRLAAEARQPLLQLGAAPRLALRLRRLLAEPARRGLVGLDQNRPVVAPQPIGHRPPELLALTKDGPARDIVRIGTKETDSAMGTGGSRGPKIPARGRTGRPPLRAASPARRARRRQRRTARAATNSARRSSACSPAAVADVAAARRMPGGGPWTRAPSRQGTATTRLCSGSGRAPCWRTASTAAAAAGVRTD
jgi:hypothetical protein